MCCFKIRFIFIVHILLALVIVINCDTENNEVDSKYLVNEECKLPNKLKKEISSYAPIVNKIINASTVGQFKGKTWNYLANFVDKFGNRIAGSRNLENAIDYMLNMSKENNLENVHGENVTVPHWIRGKEHAYLLRPRAKPLPMLGLGGSIATPRRGIIAHVLVVKSFDELKQKSQEAAGKIVVFNEEYVSYGETVKYRSYAAVEAAKLGAVATLVRSVTPFSIASPHTGWQDYSSNVTKIPTACITIEDAEMLNRMYNRGEKLLIYLYMEAHTLPDTVSRNTVAEIKGSTYPEKVVLVSGHLDSWDVGEGAMDDGGGAFISWCSLVLLKSLGLRPKRTVRAVLWTAEEEGLIGAIQYATTHANETKNFNLVMESDEGTFTPKGLEFSGPNKSACIIQHILSLTATINTTNLKQSQNVGSDITVWTHNNSVPGASLLNDNGRYFWFHHSNGDTMAVEDPTALDKATALWAAVAYVVADLKNDLPKKITYAVD